MARIRIVSDLHLEFGQLDLEPAGEDVLLLAGDIGVGTQGYDWAAIYADRTGVRVVMIAGNHEFYAGRRSGRSINETLNELRDLSAGHPLVFFLEDAAVTLKGVRFIGATLWTDFDLNGNSVYAKLAAQRGMNDYRKIMEDNGAPFHPNDAARRHCDSRRFIEAETAKPFDGQTVVVTHHAPSRQSISGRYGSSSCNPAYASNLDELVAASGAALWVHGHMHTSFDYTIGDTRVLTNPRGYSGYEENPDFDPNLIVEI